MRTRGRAGALARGPGGLLLPALLSLAAPGAGQEPASAGEHYESARRHADAGEVEDAIEDYRRAIAADPGEWRYSYMLGEHLLSRTRRWEEALQAYRDAWKKGYERGVTRYKIGRCLEELGREGAALAEYRRSVEMNQAALATEPQSRHRLLRFQIVDAQMAAALLEGGRRAFEEAYERLHASLVYGPDPEQERRVRGTGLKVGHVAFGDGDYDTAIRFYSLALLDVDTGRPLASLAWDDFPDWRIATDRLLEVVEDRRRLGAVDPVQTHRVLALVILDQTVEYERDGRTVRVHRVMTERQKREAEERLRWLRQILESLSDGRYSLSYTMVEDTTAYRYQGQRRPPWVGDRTIIAERIDDFDTLLRLWPWGQGTGTGGASRLSLAPARDAAPLRGVMDLHPEHSHGMWLHEFFHVVEAMAGIQPTHGYYDEARGSFPTWRGRKNDQLDYFRWHFRTTLPRVGWERLNFRLRFSLDGS